MTTNFFDANENDIVFLKKQWNDLTALYTSDVGLRDESFQTLKEMYSEKGRFYHNLSHIKALLHLLEARKNKLHDHNAIRFAIWFHDAVYNTKRSDNEEKSAELASEILGRLNVNMETTGYVRDLILATKDHNGGNLQADAKLFLDMDLAILGVAKEIYVNYSKAIREEYSWVPGVLYRRSRKKILRSFIEKERIYYTDEMNKRFEAQARMNINGEIESL